MKLDELEYTDEDELIEYLDNAAEDEIIVDEPVVDDITEYELPNGDTQDAEVDLQSIIPAIEYDVQTTVETIEENNFDCKICDKGTKNLIYPTFENKNIFIFVLSVQDCQGTGRTHECNSRIDGYIL